MGEVWVDTYILASSNYVVVPRLVLLVLIGGSEGKYCSNHV